MPVDEKDTLRVYLQRVMELSNERSTGMTDLELKAIAREVGISDADLAAAEQSAKDHQTRGVGYLDHQRFDDAIDELSEAAALAPGRFETMHALASAHAGRYKQHGHSEDRQKAETLARRCLELDPRHQVSFGILNDLDLAVLPVSGRARGSNPAKGVVVAGLLATVGGLWWLQASQDGPDLTPPVTSPAAVVQEAESTAAIPAPGADFAVDAEAVELDLPIELETELDLGFEVRLSRFNRYVNGRAFYKLNAILENLGTTELEKISARLELRGEPGQVLTRKNVDLLTSSDPALRPGDLKALRFLIEASDGVRRASLIVERADQTPAASDYGTAKPIQVHWQEAQPSGMAISARERTQRFSENTLADKGAGYFDAVLEIENSGTRSIRALKLKGEVIGQDGRWTTDIERHIVIASGPDLREGGVRIVRFLTQVQERPESYRVSVIGIQ